MLRALDEACGAWSVSFGTSLPQEGKDAPKPLRPKAAPVGIEGRLGIEGRQLAMSFVD